jgi:hypothetical protein
MPRTPTDEQPVISFRMSPELTDSLRQVSDARQWSMNAFVVAALIVELAPVEAFLDHRADRLVRSRRRPPSCLWC